MSDAVTTAPRVDGALGARPSSRSVQYRTPTAADGRAVHRLVREAGGLEPNTGYAYVLLCDHFAKTTVLAEADDGLLGFVAAYVPPGRDDTVFVWQVGVHPTARGLGIASSLLDAVVSRPACREVSYLEATVGPSNGASRRLFEAFAQRHEAPFTWTQGYDATHFDGPHEPEDLIRIGPLRPTPGGSTDASSPSTPLET